MRNRVSTRTARVLDFELHGIRNSQNGRLAVLGFTVDGQLALPTRSFWRSLMVQFPAAAQLSNHASEQPLDEAEFFHRLRELQPTAEVQYDLDRDDDGNAVLMAPRPRTGGRGRIKHQRTTDLVRHYGDAYFMSASWGTSRFSRN